MQTYFGARLALLAALFVASAEAEEMQDHSHHHVAPGFTRSVQTYQIPDLQLVRDDGVSVSSARLFDTQQTVIVSFIFTSCTAVCPVLTATLTQTRKHLGAAADRVRIVSVSIDPDYDTPARLSAYAKQHKASGDWRFFTGNQEAIVTLQKAFNAFRGDKNNHVPLALIRPAGKRYWVRYEGFTSATVLANEIEQRSGS